LEFDFKLRYYIKCSARPRWRKESGYSSRKVTLGCSDCAAYPNRHEHPTSCTRSSHDRRQLLLCGLETAADVVAAVVLHPGAVDACTELHG
jgi:hypothetical protein